MIQTESTPNPESLKFLSENTISAIGTEEFQKSQINQIKNAFIKELLSFKGVELVLLSKNFLSVKKTKDISWNELKPTVISHLNHYFENNKDPILKEEKETKIEHTSDETIKKMLEFKGDIFPDYTQANFEKYLLENCKIISKGVVSNSGRTIYEYKRN